MKKTDGAFLVPAFRFIMLELGLAEVVNKKQKRKRVLEGAKPVWFGAFVWFGWFSFFFTQMRLTLPWASQIVFFIR